MKKVFYILLFAGAILLLLAQKKPAPKSSLPYSTDKLYVINSAVLGKMSFGHQTAFQALQGIVNQKGKPQIFIETNKDDIHDKDWLAYLQSRYGASPAYQDGFDWYFEVFAKDLTGYVLYDSIFRPDSINIALSTAGAASALPVDFWDFSLKKMIGKSGLSMIEDVRQWSYQDLKKSKYWPLFSKDGAIFLHPKASLPNPRDFGAAKKFVFFYRDFTKDKHEQEIKELFFDYPKGAVFYGWGHTDKKIGEDSFVAQTSRLNAGFVGADRAGNLSVYGGYPLLQKPKEKALSLPTEKDVHYVTFIISDGDNLQAILNTFSHPSAGLYGRKRASGLPIGWTIPPLLSETAPPILQWIYDNRQEGDHFLAGPSGWAYVYPSLFPDKKLLQEKNVFYLEKNNLSALVDFDFIDSGGFQPEAIKALAAGKTAGVFFFEYRWRDPEKGKIIFAGAKLAVPVVRFGYERPAGEELEKIAQAINSAPKDASQARGYTALYAQMWTVKVADLEKLVQKLDPNVRIVPPDIFLRLMAENLDKNID